MLDHYVTLRRKGAHVLSFYVRGPIVDTITFAHPKSANIVEVPPTAAALTKLQQWAMLYGVALFVDPPVTEYVAALVKRPAVDHTQYTLSDKLYAHQATGVNALLTNYAHNANRLRALIADDPRLGKSAQALSALKVISAVNMHGPILIVCPKALMRQWETYVRDWFDRNANIVLLTGTAAERIATLKHVMPAIKPPVVIANWEFLTQPGVTAVLRSYNWWAIIGDEAHKLKNRNNNVSKAMAVLAKRATHVLLLSATFVENLPDNWWSPLHILLPERFNSYWRFVHQYVKTEVNEWGYVKLIGPKHSDLLAAELAPFVLRRKTTDVDVIMPDQIFETVVCDLDEVHRAFYNKFEKQVRIELTDHTLTVPNQAARIVRLRQACLHPALIDNLSNIDVGVSKLATLQALLNQLPPDEQAIVYCTFVDGCRAIAQMLTVADWAVSVFAGDNAYVDAIDAFKRGETRILITTPQKGGVGLNLYNANYIYYVDVPWSTIDLRQSQERTRAMGKSGPTYVTKLVARATIDEYVDSVVLRKLTNADEASVTAAVVDHLTGA